MPADRGVRTARTGAAVDGARRGGGSPLDAAEGAGPRRPVSIVAPTLREAANIQALVERVDAAMRGAGIEWELLLIDDDSDDGSEEIVAGLARRLPVRIEVRRGVPPGLALAVIDGIRLARHDLVVVMDADLSHPPERIRDLIAALEEGAFDGAAGGGEAGGGEAGGGESGNGGTSDGGPGGAAGAVIAVGSRYAPGARLDRAWGLYRVLNSRLATWLARPLVRCSDPMSGFFAVDRRALPDLATLAPAGYKIGLELMVRGRLRVREVAIDFVDRDRGASKMNWRQQLAYLRHLRRLYAWKFETPARVLSFGLVGASGLVIDVAVYLALERLGVDHRLARFLAFWPAVTSNWWLNRRLTFGDRPRRPRARQWACFAVGSALGLVVNVGSYLALTGLVPAFAERRLAALLVGVGVGAAVNYGIAAGYVYRRGSVGSGDR